MSTAAIISSASIDVNKVTFGDIRMNKAGGKSVPIKYNGQSLQIRIPRMGYPMGIQIKDNENGTSYTISATLKGCDPYAKEMAGPEVGEIGNLYNFLIQLQERLVKYATENSGKWFGKARKEDVIRDTMKAILNPSVEKVDGEWRPTGKYPPSLRMKVPVYDGKVSMDVANYDGRPIEVDTDNLSQVFPKRVEASLVVAPSIYVSGQGFGITWRITYARVSPPQRLTAADVFRDEIQEELRTTAPAPAPTEETLEEDAIEEEHHEESAPAPAPAPAPKNRRRGIAVA
jgi:hypothetical protein